LSPKHSSNLFFYTFAWKNNNCKLYRGGGSTFLEKMFRVTSPQHTLLTYSFSGIVRECFKAEI